MSDAPIASDKIRGRPAAANSWTTTPQGSKRLGSTKQPLVLVNSASCLGCKNQKFVFAGY